MYTIYVLLYTNAIAGSLLVGHGGIRNLNSYLHTTSCEYYHTY